MCFCSVSSAPRLDSFSLRIRYEKQILLPLLPASLLYVRGHENFSLSFGLVAAFSLFPLLRREGLASAYFCCVLLFSISNYFLGKSETKRGLLFYVSLLTMGCRCGVPEGTRKISPSLSSSFQCPLLCSLFDFLVLRYSIALFGDAS